MVPAHKFSIGFHNIQGMHYRSGCKINDIKEELVNDIEILAETWGCKCDINYDNYILKQVAPQKHSGIKKGRASGGFSVLIRNYLAKSTIIKKSSNNFVWIEVDKSCIKNLNKNVFIVGTYINDITSTYYDDKIFEELYTDILNFSREETPILIIGDFNGRTGDLDDNYSASEHVSPSIPSPNPFVELPRRNNCDSVCNSHGKKIIQICKTFDLKILNGRMIGDSMGNCTHLNINNGSSTIDYSLCNQYLYDYVENFIVLPQNELSDHSKICTIFKTSVPNDRDLDEYNWKPLPSRFKWDPKSRKKFSNCLKTN